MDKQHAIKLLGGTVTSAAEACGITPSAVSQWPDPLPPRLADRVLAALARKSMAMAAIVNPPSASDEKAAA